MSSSDTRFMEFRVGDQLYAIPLMSVREVLQRPETTPVPNMPSHFEGMMNLRGQILGVFSTRKKLMASGDKSPPPDHPVVIVIEEEGVVAGIVVDEVTRVVNPLPEQLGAAPVRAGDPAAAFVSGVIKLDEKLILTLKLSDLLGLQQLQRRLAA